MQEFKNLQKNLIDLRKQFNYTQAYVASQIGVTCQSYQGYEWGLSVPTLKHFIELAKLYGVSYDDLLE